MAAAWMVVVLVVQVVSGEEEEEYAEEAHERKLKLNIIVLTVTALVGISLTFETLKDYLLEHTSDNMLPIINSLFGELTLLGFIGLSLYLIFQMRWVGALSKRLYGEENELNEVGEVVHMVLFMVMVLFLGQAVAMARMGEATQKKWTEWDARSGATLSRKTRSLAREYIKAPYLDFLLRPSHPRQLRALIFAATRTQFLKSEHLPSSTDEFDFANYLAIALGRTFAEIVEVPVKTWLGLEACLLVFFFIDSSISKPMQFALWVFLGYCILGVAFITHAKLRAVLRAHVAAQVIAIVAANQHRAATDVEMPLVGPAAGRLADDDRAENDNDDDDDETSRRRLGAVSSSSSTRDVDETPPSRLEVWGNAAFEWVLKVAEWLAELVTMAFEKVQYLVAIVATGANVVYDKARDLVASSTRGPSNARLLQAPQHAAHHGGGHQHYHGEPEKDPYVGMFWFGETRRAHFTQDVIRCIPLFMSIYIAVFCLIYVPRLKDPENTVLRHLLNIFLVTISCIPPVALQLKLPFVVEDFTVAANVGAFLNRRFVEQVLTHQKTVAAFQALRVVACLQHSELLANILNARKLEKGGGRGGGGAAVEESERVEYRHREDDDELDDELVEKLEKAESIERRRRRSWHNIFRLFDTDDEGSIDRGEMKTMLTKFSISDDSAEHIDEIISALDEDDSGEISFEEFYEFGKMLEHHFHNNIHPKQLIDDVFKMIDKDRGGTITVEELHTTMTDIGLDLSLNVVYNMIKDIDEDGSGSLDHHEFHLLIDRMNAGFPSEVETPTTCIGAFNTNDVLSAIGRSDPILSYPIRSDPIRSDPILAIMLPAVL
ncbi:hypothetical protein CTAYLR_005236 [Chrysophaeum taylorii]|uniref:Calmodulin n=1 Tax=Chrysophaeum taylorii TaxID=2483200 RepID=A0AAD7UB83_9STRA|nr:hypothetical protein CTAYLR_005236 [Chrysophaeum taylorii]